jgi:hypothetical protein
MMQLKLYSSTYEVVFCKKKKKEIQPEFNQDFECTCCFTGYKDEEIH